MYIYNIVLCTEIHFRWFQNMILTLMLLLLFFLSHVSKLILIKVCFPNNFNNIYIYDISWHQIFDFTKDLAFMFCLLCYTVLLNEMHNVWAFLILKEGNKVRYNNPLIGHYNYMNGYEHSMRNAKLDSIVCLYSIYIHIA